MSDAIKAALSSPPPPPPSPLLNLDDMLDRATRTATTHTISQHESIPSTQLQLW